MMRVTLLSLMLSSIALVIHAQSDKASEILFQPKGYLPDSLPNMGLSTVKGAQTVLLYDVLNNRPNYNDPYLGTYSHHGHLARLDDMLVAMWSNHYGDEDSPGQYIRYSISRDGGITWQNPDPEMESGTTFGAVLFPPLETPIRNPQPRDADGNKVGDMDDPINGYRPHDNCGTGIRDQGKSYENDLCGHYHLEMCANGYATFNGRLFALAEVAKGINDIGIGRAVREIKSDGSLGNIFWLNDDVPAFEEITPNAINTELYTQSRTDEALANEIILHLQDPFHMPQWDFYHAGWPQKDGKAAKDWKTTNNMGVNEPTYAYTMKDGGYARLWRSKIRKLFAHFSYDQGQSWTPIEETSFPDSKSRTHAGNLPNGRAYIINNANPRGRNPLVLSISEDGKLFDTAYVLRRGDPGPKDPLGRAKDTGYQYPHSFIFDNHLLVIYTINKESVAVTRLPISAL